MNNNIKYESLGLMPRYEAPSSWWEHVPIAHVMVEILKPETVVELGSHYGVSFFSFCEAAEKYSPNTYVYAIDTWQGDKQAGYYGEKIYAKVKDHRDKYHSQRSSLLKSLFENAAAKFEDNSIDILHIDGLHTYEAVKEDYYTWKDKVKDNGTILFHDWNVRSEGFGVWKLWEEIKKDKSYSCLEVKNGHGLGIATKTKGGTPDWHTKIKEDIEIFKCKGLMLDNINKVKNRQDELRARLKELEAHIKNLEEMVIDKQNQIERADQTLMNIKKGEAKRLINKIKRFMNR